MSSTTATAAAATAATTTGPSYSLLSHETEFVNDLIESTMEIDSQAASPFSLSADQPEMADVDTKDTKEAKIEIETETETETDTCDILDQSQIIVPFQAPKHPLTSVPVPVPVPMPVTAPKTTAMLPPSEYNINNVPEFLPGSLPISAPQTSTMIVSMNTDTCTPISDQDVVMSSIVSTLALLKTQSQSKSYHQLQPLPSSSPSSQQQPQTLLPTATATAATTGTSNHMDFGIQTIKSISCGTVIISDPLIRDQSPSSLAGMIKASLEIRLSREVSEIEMNLLISFYACAKGLFTVAVDTICKHVLVIDPMNAIAITLLHLIALHDPTVISIDLKQKYMLYDFVAKLKSLQITESRYFLMALVTCRTDSSKFSLKAHPQSQARVPQISLPYQRDLVVGIMYAVLGIIYRDGYGDHVNANACFQCGSELQDPSSMNSYAVNIIANPFNCSHALSLFRFAAIQGNASAIFNIGTTLLSQLQTSIAIEWFKVSAAKGHPTSNIQLGQQYFKNAETPNGINQEILLLGVTHFVSAFESGYYKADSSLLKELISINVSNGRCGTSIHCASIVKLMTGVGSLIKHFTLSLLTIFSSPLLPMILPKLKNWLGDIIYSEIEIEMKNKRVMPLSLQPSMSPSSSSSSSPPPPPTQQLSAVSLPQSSSEGVHKKKRSRIAKKAIQVTGYAVGALSQQNSFLNRYPHIYTQILTPLIDAVSTTTGTGAGTGTRTAAAAAAAAASSSTPTKQSLPVSLPTTPVSSSTSRSTSIPPVRVNLIDTTQISDDKSKQNVTPKIISLSTELTEADFNTFGREQMCFIDALIEIDKKKPHDAVKKLLGLYLRAPKHLPAMLLLSAAFSHYTPVCLTEANALCNLATESKVNLIVKNVSENAHALVHWYKWLCNIILILEKTLESTLSSLSSSSSSSFSSTTITFTSQLPKAFSSLLYLKAIIGMRIRFGSNVLSYIDALPTERELFNVMQRSANLGNVFAMNRMGYCYCGGCWGVGKNGDVGKNWFQRAIYEGDSITARFNLASVLIQSHTDASKTHEIARADIDRALGLYVYAAENGSSEAMMKLGNIYLTGIMSYINIDIGAAYAWFTRALHGNHPAAAERISQVLNTMYQRHQHQHQHQHQQKQ